MTIDYIILSYNQNQNLKYQIKNIYDKVNNIIIVNNNSTEIYDEYKDTKIKYIELKYEGIDKRAYARNIGFERSTSDVVCFLDGDCIPQKNNVDIIKSFYSNRNNNILVGIKENMIKLTNKQLDVCKEQIKLDKFKSDLNIDFDFYHETNWNRIASFCFTCRRKNFKKFDVSFKGWGFEDTELFFRLYKEGCKFFHSYIFRVYHIQHNNIIVEKNLKQLKKNADYFLRKHKNKAVYNYIKTLEILIFC